MMDHETSVDFNRNSIPFRLGMTAAGQYQRRADEQEALMKFWAACIVSIARGGRDQSIWDRSIREKVEQLQWMTDDGGMMEG